MTKNHLKEFESIATVLRWMEAMEQDTAIVVADRESIHEKHPDEYALYEWV